MFARFDENQAMTFQDIKETKRYGRTDGCTHGHTHAHTDNVKTVYPPQTKFAGGIIRDKLVSEIYKISCLCPSLALFLLQLQDNQNRHKPGTRWT